MGSEGDHAALELLDPEQCGHWPGQSSCLQFYTWASASPQGMEVLVSSTSWMYLEVWLLPQSSVPSQSSTFLDRAGAPGLYMEVLTLSASPHGMGVLTLSASWTQLEVELMACIASSPQGEELLSSPGVAGNKKLEALLFLEGEDPPRVLRWT